MPEEPLATKPDEVKKDLCADDERETTKKAYLEVHEHADSMHRKQVRGRTPQLDASMLDSMDQTSLDVHYCMDHMDEDLHAAFGQILRAKTKEKLASINAEKAKTGKGSS
ncbi:MAG: hypothetical protein Q9193_001784 [Seirophora villosa]